MTDGQLSVLLTCLLVLANVRCRYWLINIHSFIHSQPAYHCCPSLIHSDSVVRCWILSVMYFLTTYGP